MFYDFSTEMCSWKVFGSNETKNAQRYAQQILPLLLYFKTQLTWQDYSLNHTFVTNQLKPAGCFGIVDF